MRIALLFFSAGIIGFQFLSTLPSQGMLMSVLVLAGAAAAGQWIPAWRASVAASTPRRLARCSTAACASLIGVAWAGWYAHAALDSRLDPAAGPYTVEWIGEVVSIPQRDPRRVRFEFKPRQIINAPSEMNVPHRVQLTWYGHYGDVEAGDVWRWSVRLRGPQPHRGAFDEQRWHLVRGLDASGTVHGEGAERLSRRVNLARIRARIAQRVLEAAPDTRTGAVLVALVVGDQQFLPDSSWRVLNGTGTGHLLSISGMHVGFVAGIGLVGIGWLWRRSARLCRFAPASLAGTLGGFALAMAYAALAGFALPTQRAVLMLCVGCAVIVLRRFIHPWQGLVLAMALVLLWDPTAPLTGGFWLSFGAVAAILAAMRGHARWSAWYSALRLQWLLSLVLLPVLVAWFAELPVSSPLANLVAIPVVTILVVPSALLGALLLWLWAPAGTALLAVAAALVDWLLDGLAWLHGISEVPGVFGASPVWATLCAILGALLLLAPAGLPGRQWAVPLLAVLAVASWQRPEPGQLWLSAERDGIYWRTHSRTGTLTGIEAILADGVAIEPVAESGATLIRTGATRLLVAPAYALSNIPEGVAPVDAVLIVGGTAPAAQLASLSHTQTLVLQRDAFSAGDIPHFSSGERLIAMPQGIDWVRPQRRDRYYHSRE